MKTIEYVAFGWATFSDGEVEQHAREFLGSKRDYCCVSSELFITVVRALVAEGFIPHDQVQFTFQGETLQPNASGSLQSYPVGFCDANELVLHRILKARMATVQASSGTT